MEPVMGPSHVSVYDPQDRDREKQRSREADAAALANGQKSRDQLRAENAFIPLHLARQPLDWSRVASVKGLRVDSLR